MSELDEEGVLKALEEARQAQLVVEVPDARRPASPHARARAWDFLQGRAWGAAASSAAAPERRSSVRTRRTSNRCIFRALAHHGLAGAGGTPEKALEYSLRAGAAAQQSAGRKSPAVRYKRRSS